MSCLLETHLTFQVVSNLKNKNLIFVIALIQPAEKNNLNQPLLLMIQQTRTVISKTSKRFVEKDEWYHNS